MSRAREVLYSKERNEIRNSYNYEAELDIRCAVVSFVARGWKFRGPGRGATWLLRKEVNDTGCTE